jgi:hypothetical protein
VESRAEIPIDDAPAKTNIVCKYFLEAVETNKYGYFWICTNGDSCKYQHKLPSDYKPPVRIESKKEISLEEWMELKKLDITTHTPINQTTFMVWKENKKKERDLQVLEEQRENNKKSGKELFVLRVWDDAEDVMDVGVQDQDRQEQDHGESIAVM